MHDGQKQTRNATFHGASKTKSKIQTERRTEPETETDIDRDSGRGRGQRVAIGFMDSRMSYMWHRIQRKCSTKIFIMISKCKTN